MADTIAPATGTAGRHPTSRPVFARHAVSLLVVRQRPLPEVLMGVRRAGHRFLPNQLVFPGGAVDPADRAAPAATEPRPDLIQALQRSATPRLARAIAIAAARELEEETGLTLGAPPRLDTLDYLCRAVTPPASPIRFNARFLVVYADAVSGTPADSDELQDVRFVPLEQAAQAGLMLVTAAVLDKLRAWLALPETERRPLASLPVFKLRTWQQEPGLRRYLTARS